MRHILLILQFLVVFEQSSAQNGFSKPIDIGIASSFSSIAYKDGIVTVYGVILDQNTPPYWDNLFYQSDTSGNIINYQVYADIIGDDFTGPYPNSFIQLADSSGFAGIGTFFGRESGYLILYNNDGTVQKFVEYPDPDIRVAFYIEIIEVPDGFFILGDKQLNDYHSHIFLMKTDKSGNKLWEKLYGHPTRENSFGSIFRVHNNEYVIGGATTSIPNTPQLVYNTSNFYVIDSLGALNSSWQSPLSTTDMGVGYGMNRTTQGGWIYSTIETQFKPPLNVIERKLKFIERDSDYNIIHEKSYGNFRPNNIVQNLKTLSNGDYLLLGSRSVQFSSQAQYPNLNMGSLLRLSPDGDSIWNFVDTAYGLAQNRVSDAVELPSGSIIACGYSRTLNPVKDWSWLIKINHDGCIDTLNCVSVPTKETISTQKKVNIYPNPTTNEVYFNVPETEALECLIFNMSGKLVKKTTASAGKIDFSTLPAGVYFLKIVTRNGILSDKVIKN